MSRQTEAQPTPCLQLTSQNTGAGSTEINEHEKGGGVFDGIRFYEDR